MDNSWQPFLIQLCNHKLCTYLNDYLLEAPCKYVRQGLIHGLNWTSYQLSFTCIFLVCPGSPSILLFVPTIHVSYMHPPLPTRRLNACAQVNNMAMLHYMYMVTHIYITFILLSIPSSYLFHSFGQAGWLRPFLSVTPLIYILYIFYSGTVDSEYLTYLEMPVYQFLCIHIEPAFKVEFLLAPNTAHLCITIF